MLYAIVLGAAAGGGVPQWNCGCANCQEARGPRRDPVQSASTQVSIAVSANDRDWILINASPDLRQQINATPQLHPRAGALRHSPIAGVILTNAEVDAIAGLLSLREGSPFSIYAPTEVLDVLRDNNIFRVLDATKVPRVSVGARERFEPQISGNSIGLRITSFQVPGKPALYIKDQAADRDGPTIGLRIEDMFGGKSICVVTACARVTDELKTQIADCDILLFDGTLWRDDELIAAGLGNQTGKRMGHQAMGGADGVIATFAGVKAGRKVFVHINNSNPVWHASPEREAAERAGWEIGYDGMEFTL